MTPGPPKYIRHYMGVAWSLLRSAEDQREHVLVHGGVDGLERSLEFATECGGPAERVLVHGGVDGLELRSAEDQRERVLVYGGVD